MQFNGMRYVFILMHSVLPGHGPARFPGRDAMPRHVQGQTCQRNNT